MSSLPPAPWQWFLFVFLHLGTPHHIYQTRCYSTMCRTWSQPFFTVSTWRTLLHSWYESGRLPHALYCLILSCDSLYICIFLLQFFLRLFFLLLRSLRSSQNLCYPGWLESYHPPASPPLPKCWGYIYPSCDFFSLCLCPSAVWLWCKHYVLRV